MGLGQGGRGEDGKTRGTGEAVERVGRLGDITLIKAAGRDVGNVVW